MTHDFQAAMRGALAATRAGNPQEATARIQAALSGRPAPTAPEADAEPCCGPCEAMAAEKARASAAPGRSPFSDLGNLSGLRDMADLPGLKGLSGLGGMAQSGAKAPVPEGATVEWARHGTGGAARDYRLFIPSPRPGGYTGLVLMLHGCTQSPEDFALGTRMDLAAEAAGFVVAYPGQTGAHNAQSCWNWFRPQDQQRGGGEPALLASLAETLAARFDTEGRSFVAGLSAGGAMAAILAETYPDVFSAAGIHSGLPAGSARDVASAFAAMRGQGAEGAVPTLPVIVFHGTSDSTVSPSNAERLVPGDGVETQHEGGGRRWTHLTTRAGSELWRVEGAGHAWFGGDPSGSYADRAGPEASAEMLRFFAALT